MFHTVLKLSCHI